MKRHHKYSEDICANCGGTYGLHNHMNKRCPKNINADKDHTEYRDTVFAESPSPGEGEAVAFAEWMRIKGYFINGSDKWENDDMDDDKMYTTADLYQLFPGKVTAAPPAAGEKMREALKVLIDNWQDEIKLKQSFEARAKELNNVLAETMWRHKREGLEIAARELKEALSQPPGNDEWVKVEQTHDTMVLAFNNKKEIIYFKSFDYNRQKEEAQSASDYAQKLNGGWYIAHLGKRWQLEAADPEETTRLQFNTPFPQ